MNLTSIRLVRPAATVLAVAGLAVAVLALAARPALAYEIDILHDTNPPPQSDALLTYLDSVRPETHNLVGFDAADIGEGEGDGRNEIVGVSFEFDPPAAVYGALLWIELTRGGSGSESDNISFADNMSPWGPDGYAYANELIAAAPQGVRSMVRVDLSNVPGRTGDGFHYNLLELLEDGTLDVAVTDDSFVHSLRLQIRTTAAPTLDDLADLVRAAHLHHGIENALLAKIRAAGHALDDGDERDARGSLGAFLNHVRAQRGKKISHADADAFSEMARAILDGMSDATESMEDGLARSVGSDGASLDSTADFALSSSAPNPFALSTEIRFEMFRRAEADLGVYDVSGRRLRTIRHGMTAAGEHAVVWDGRNDAGSRVVAGTYFVRLLSNGRVETKRVVLLGR